MSAAANQTDKQRNFFSAKGQPRWVFFFSILKEIFFCRLNAQLPLLWLVKGPVTQPAGQSRFGLLEKAYQI